MNIALVIAGGSGQRMGQDIPKQFLNVYDKPVLIYTLEAFERHPNIDEIAVVCLPGWDGILRAYGKQFGITKLSLVVDGGDVGQASIRNGVTALAKDHDENDLVLVHDGIRPMLSEEVISDAIRVCTLHGNSVTVIPCAEAMLRTEDGLSSTAQVPRDNLKRTQTPQTFPLRTLVWAHKTALEKGITNSVASCTMMIELGQELFFSAGSEKNIKITTPEDIDMFKAMLRAEKSDWMR